MEQESYREQAARYGEWLQSHFDCWERYRRGDTTDPYNSDGHWMNRARRDILYYKNLIADKLPPEHYPPCYHRETPLEVSEAFMARPDEIRENALRALSAYSADENYHYILDCKDWLTPAQRKECHVGEILSYVPALDRAIREDDYVQMRRFSNISIHQSLFEFHARQIKHMAVSQQLNFFFQAEDYENGMEP